ncbi:MAG: hypothetical protein OXE94_05065 [Aestuariivita sp.]|nr:hypothetical protein [Aestuariivita sp.]MCY4201950.1 hypothetical protein [Aestuariivita sp.]MCY4288835.1 hypothetical protein [Aestuariivita sp.]MCY4345244.1 hypothetical protein [Aestuariivita sp.]
MKNTERCTANEDLPPPTPIVPEKTKSRPREISERIEAEPNIYPKNNASLAIDSRTPNSTIGVLIVIEQYGSGTLFYPTRSSDGWTSYEDAANLYSKGGADELQGADVR